MINPRFTIHVSLLTFALSGCHTSISREFWELSLAAKKPVVSRDPAMLHTVALVDPDPDVGQFCTGVVIDRRMILTAAHCFDDQQRIPFVLMEKDYAPGMAFDERYSLLRIELAAIHSGYRQQRSVAYNAQLLNTTDHRQVPSPGGPLHDIAIALLENDVFPPYRGVRLALGNEDLKTTGIFSVGYGCSTSACDEAESELHKADMRFVKTIPDSHLIVLAAHGGRSPCDGNGGGPHFRWDRQGLNLLALRTSGSESCERGLFVDTLIAPYRSWIERGMKVLLKPMVAGSEYRVIDLTDSSDGT